MKTINDLIKATPNINPAFKAMFETNGGNETDKCSPESMGRSLDDLEREIDELGKNIDSHMETLERERAFYNKFELATEEFKIKYPNQFEWVNNDLQNKFPEVSE